MSAPIWPPAEMEEEECYDDAADTKLVVGVVELIWRA